MLNPRLLGLWIVALAATPGMASDLTLAPNERLITILGTNDIHGGLEAGKSKDGSPIGGMDFWAGVTRSIRQGLKSRFADRAGVVLLDAGDQFQGTLISNHNEGQLMFSVLNEFAAKGPDGAVLKDASGKPVDPGYDAVITGNHDYDFGPVGWLEDQVTPTSADQRPRGALLDDIATADFPVLSANTYLRASMADSSGNAIDVSDQHCKPKGQSVAIDWSRAQRPDYLQPYLVKTVAGVRVAVVGLDNPETPIVTTEANVTDLCFADEADAYLRVRQSLEGQADVFVILIHDGDTDKDFPVQNLVRALPAGTVDAVVSGHTHFTINARVNGVAVIQSGSGGTKFGRIDLVYDTDARAVVQARTRSYGGIDLLHDRCAPAARDFCAAQPGQVAYEGVPVAPDAQITALVSQGRATIAPLAGTHLGTAAADIRIDRTRESPLADAMTDAFRLLSRADISFMNTGGLRAPIPAGEFDYEALFKVIPFNNHGLIVGPMGADKVVALLSRSIQTCGAYGALMQSGLKVTFTRDCSHAVSEVDPNARLLKVSTLQGETIYDASQTPALVAPMVRVFQVATLDFLAAGGAGFDGFAGTPVVQDVGIVREAMKDYYSSSPVSLSAAVDGRWSEQLPGR